MKAYVKKTIRSDKELEERVLIENITYNDYENMKKKYGHIRLLNDEGLLLEEYNVTILINKYEFVDDSKDPTHAIRYTDYDDVIKIMGLDSLIGDMRVFVEPFENTYISFYGKPVNIYKIQNGKIFISKLDIKHNWFNIEDCKKVEYSLREAGYKLYNKLVKSIESLDIREKIKHKLLDMCKLKEEAWSG